MNLSRQLAPQKPDLIVWPETATPFYLFHNHFYNSFTLIIGHIEKLTGAPEWRVYKIPILCTFK